MDWSPEENEIIVQAYFEMLRKELSGEKYSKTKVRENIFPLLNSRSHPSIEWKLRNISAVLMENGYPYINGYKPANRYQIPLQETVFHYLENTQYLKPLFEGFTQTLFQYQPIQLDYASLVNESPATYIPNKDISNTSRRRLSNPNYLQIEQQNRALGELGEELIVNYEKWRLDNAGKGYLAKRIEWVSKEQGDGAGFDILSKNLDGSVRFIEVKTTKLGEDVPIFCTRNELAFSKDNSSNFHLYRVYKFFTTPQFFVKDGAIDSYCKLEPTNYIGRF